MQEHSNGRDTSKKHLAQTVDEISLRLFYHTTAKHLGGNTTFNCGDSPVCPYYSVAIVPSTHFLIPQLTYAGIY